MTPAQILFHLQADIARLERAAIVGDSYELADARSAVSLGLARAGASFSTLSRELEQLRRDAADHGEIHDVCGCGHRRLFHIPADLSDGVRPCRGLNADFTTCGCASFASQGGAR